MKNTGEGADEVITVLHHFHRDGAAGYALNGIEFADGTSWDAAKIKTLVQAGTAGADAPGNSQAKSLGSIDMLYAYAGNDTLNGGADIAYLYEGLGSSPRRGAAGVHSDLHGEAGSAVESTVLANNHIDKLVSAMAGYGAPGGAGSVAPRHGQDEWQAVITAVWQAT